MLDYAGQPCMHCGVPFTEQDDIVTCPDCGTPYHRACYKEAGRCENTALHESGGSWVLDRQAEIDAAKTEQRRKEIAEEAIRNQNAGTTGSYYAGVRLDPNDPCIGLNPEEKIGEATVGEFASFIKTNCFYYLPLFRLMQRTGRHASFNLICIFCPQLYFANRKMMGMAVFSLILDMIVGLPSMLYYLNSMMGVTIPWLDVQTVLFDQVSMIAGLIGLLLSGFWCLFANYFYYRHTLRKLRSIKKHAETEEMKSEMIAAKGGTSLAMVALTLVLQMTILFVLVHFLSAGSAGAMS